MPEARADFDGEALVAEAMEALRSVGDRRSALNASAVSSAVRVQAGLAIPCTDSELEAASPADFGLSGDSPEVLAALSAPRVLLRIPAGGSAGMSIGPWDGAPSSLARGPGAAALGLCVLVDAEEGSSLDAALSFACGVSSELPSGLVVGVRAGRNSRIRLSSRAVCVSGGSGWGLVAGRLSEGALAGECSLIDSSGFFRLSSRFELLSESSRLSSCGLSLPHPGGMAERFFSVSRVARSFVGVAQRHLHLGGGESSFSVEGLFPEDADEASFVSLEEAAMTTGSPSSSSANGVPAIPLDERMVLDLRFLGIPESSARRLAARSFAASLFDGLREDAAFAPLSGLKRFPVEDAVVRLVSAMDAALSAQAF
jgi:hypothetical protein